MGLDDQRKIYDLLKIKDRTLAELCLAFDLDYRKDKKKVITAIDRMCEVNVPIYEEETKNNIWYGLLEHNEEVYMDYFKEVL